MRSFIITCVVLGLMFVGMSMTCQHSGLVHHNCTKCGMIIEL